MQFLQASYLTHLKNSALIVEIRLSATTIEITQNLYLSSLFVSHVITSVVLQIDLGVGVRLDELFTRFNNFAARGLGLMQLAKN